MENQTNATNATNALLQTNKAIAPDLDALKVAVDQAVNPALLEKIAERDRKIQELEITVKNHREQFDQLNSHFVVTLKAIAMNLNALKGERKGDREEEVDGVKIRYRSYSDNLTHRQKTLIVEHLQLAIAEEAKKLKAAKLKDLSFDDIPF